MALLTSDFLWSGAVICVGLMYLSFIFLNKIGRHFLARFLVVFMANNALMVMVILFTHDSYLDIYFLIICGITLLVFDYNERKWFYALMAYLIVLLVIESTPLQHYLPAFNLINEQDIPTMNSVLILGVIVFILIQARILVVVCTL